MAKNYKMKTNIKKGFKILKTIKKETIIEYEEKKSKFIGYAKPISTVYEAEKFIKKINQKIWWL